MFVKHPLLETGMTPASSVMEAVMENVSSVGRARAADSEILLAAARPELFRDNAFRVTGLPVDSTAGDIVRREERIRMAAKFGGGAHIPSPLPISPAPSGDMVRAAVDRLRDPERRLVDEFFW